MKSYNGLYDRMIEPDEIKAAILDAAKHKRSRRSVRRVLSDLDGEAERIREKIVEGRYAPPKHKSERVQEGAHRKERQIEKPWFCDEQIIHHLLMRQLKPILIPRMYAYSFGSLPKRGALKAARTMCKWRDSYGGRKFYVAELDIHKFYPSVNKETLKGQLRKLIRDKRYLDVLFSVIDGSDNGLPLGYYTSPWLGHLYLMPLDNFIKQELKPDYYLRYMDNLFIFHRNKKELRKMVEAISAFIAGYDLELNGSRQIYRFEYADRRTGQVRGRAINALGYVIHRNRVTMRKSILKRSRAKTNRIGKTRRLRRIDAAAMISYCGWYKHTDTYNYFQKYIKPKVNIRKCRKRIAAISRKERKQHDTMERGTGR